MYDCIVIGSGIAGLYVALLAQHHGRVLLLTKAGLDDSNTNHAQGGIAAAVGATDRPELHWRDTLVAGAGLSDPTAAWVLTNEGPDRIADLIRFGVAFDREHGYLALAQEGAHSLPRVLHAGGDATGRHIQVALGNAVRRSAKITICEHHLVTEITTEGRSVDGVVALDCRSGRTARYSSHCVVLASGGAGQIFQHTTNPSVATGTGLALAYRAGASVADLEFYQFHPTALLVPGAPRFLISEAARGEGGVLVAADGRRFMADYDPRGELAPRHVVAEAILAEMARTGAPCVYLDLSHLPAQQVRQRFPTIADRCRQYGIDITREPIPVAPAAHYMMGGVRTDLWGETDLPGLFACGEVACTGVHGANRLASNSLLEALVFGARIVRRLAAGRDGRERRPDVWPAGLANSGALAYGTAGADGALVAAIPEERRAGPPAGEPDGRWPGDHAPTPEGLPAGGVQIEHLQALMWSCAGPRRSRQSLEQAEHQLALWAEVMPAATTDQEHELRDALLAARLMVAAALARRETRGAHRRLDFPREEVAWRRRLTFRTQPADAPQPAALGAISAD